MRKIFKILIEEMKKNNRVFVFVATLLLIGFVSGSLFITILNESDKQLVLDTISSFFNQYKTQEINFLSRFWTSTLSTAPYILLIWLLGVSIIGIPFILFLLFMKSFVLGFSIASIISTYKFGGLLLSLGYTFPHHILNIIVFSFIGLYALKISFTLIQIIFSKKQIHFKLVMRRYLGVLLISLILCILSNCIETFFTPYFIKLFTFLIK